MAKFIIEVDDEYIRRNASPETMKMKLDPEGTGKDVMKAMYDLMAFSSIEKRIDQGVTEFRVTRDLMPDDSRREFFERNIVDIVMLAVLAKEEESDGKSDGQED